MSQSDITTQDLSGPRIDRRTTIKLLGGAGMAGLAGCLGGDDDDDAAPGDDGSAPGVDDPDELYGGTIEAGWNLEQIANFDPPQATRTQMIYLLGNIFSGLVKLTDDLTLTGDLATDWEVADEGRELTFELREDVVFHNGDEFTAEDVAYSLNRTAEEDFPMSFALDALDQVVVEDEYTVRVELERSFAPLMVYLTPDVGRAGAIVSQNAIEEMGVEDYNQNPVGTGPFEVTEHDIGTMALLEAFDDYYETDSEGNQLPYVDNVEVQMVVEPSTRVNGLRAGDLDFISLVPAENADQLDGDSDVDVLGEPDATFGGLFFNLANGPFTSEDARRGMAKVIDRQRYVDETFFGYAQPGVGPVSPATEWAYREDKPDTLEYEPEEGQELLEQEGILDEEFELVVAQPEERGGRVLRNILQDVGVDVEVRQVDVATYTDTVPPGDFNITLWGSSGDPDPDMTLYDQFGPPEETTNWWGFEDEEVFDLLEEQRFEPDQERRKELIHDIEDHLINNAIVCVLDHQEALSAKRSHVMGYSQSIPMIRDFTRTYLDD